MTYTAVFLLLMIEMWLEYFSFYFAFAEMKT